MRLREWTISLPADMFDSPDRFRHYAMDYVRDEVSLDYCTPALWDAWFLDDDPDASEYTVCVTRLSEGPAFPEMVTGYCYEDELLENLINNPGENINIYTSRGLDHFLCKANLEGRDYCLFECPDGVYRAQLTIYTYTFAGGCDG